MSVEQLAHSIVQDYLLFQISRNHTRQTLNSLCRLNLCSFFSLPFFFPSIFFTFLGFVSLKPGPALASTTLQKIEIEKKLNENQPSFLNMNRFASWMNLRRTWFQFFFDPCGNFFHRFTSSTQALQMSPTRSSDNLGTNNKNEAKMRKSDTIEQSENSWMTPTPISEIRYYLYLKAFARQSYNTEIITCRFHYENHRYCHSRPPPVHSTKKKKKKKTYANSSAVIRS